jgi:hypothetical protein
MYLATVDNRKAELEQLAMNARCTPKPVLNAHSSDQRPQTGIDPRRPPISASASKRL